MKLSVKIQCKNIFSRTQFDNVFPLKESNDIIKEPVINATEPKTETVNEKNENEEKNNGNHTPV